MAGDKKYPMTQEGYEKLVAELDQLENVKRPEVAQRLKVAIAQGDLSENADYADAKETQGFVEGRILELTEIIRGAEIITDSNLAEDVVALGRTVTVRDKEDGSEATYQLVGAAEASPREGRISNESPLGKALLASKLGEEVVIEAPAGNIIYKIVAVE